MKDFKAGDIIISIKDKATDISIGNKYVVIESSYSRVHFDDDEGVLRDRTASYYELVTEKNSCPDIVTINGTKYQRVEKIVENPNNSSKVNKIIELYKGIIKIVGKNSYPTIMLHDFKSNEFNDKDWEVDKNATGGTVFDHKKLSGLHFFSDDKCGKDF